MVIVTKFAIDGAIMGKSIEKLIIQSILDEFAVSHQSPEELEAKALFRLLNYCPPPDLESSNFRVRPLASNGQDLD